MMRGLRIANAAAVALTLASHVPAHAEGIDFSAHEVEPWQADMGHLGFKLKGRAWGASYNADQPNFAGFNTPNVTGAVELAPSLARVYDSGMVVSLNTVLTVWHDRLSGDNFDNDFFQKVYVGVQTGLGRIEIGMNDGPAYNMAVTGPSAAGDVAIDGSNTSFFIDPATGESFTNLFSLNSASLSTQNYAKLAYYSPEVMGWKIGIAYTPSTAKNVIPFVFAAQKLADRQEDFWEAAVGYTTDWNETWVLSSYAAFVFAHNAAKTPGSAGLTDWSVGAQLDYKWSEDLTLSAGGAFRHTNAYTFDTFKVGAAGKTQSMRGALGATYGNWVASFEYAHGDADRPGEDTLGIDGIEVALGYSINENLQITGGWQSLRYRTNATFYDGRNRIRLDAFFLHANFEVDDAW